MKRFTKILASCLIVVFTILTFTACVPSTPKDIWSVQSRLCDAGHSPAVYTQKDLMESILECDLESLPYRPTAVLTLGDESNLQSIAPLLLIIEFENSYEAEFCAPFLHDKYYDLINDYNYDFGVQEDMFCLYASFTIYEEAFKATSQAADFEYIFEDVIYVFEDVFEFIEEEIFEVVVEVFEEIIDEFEEHNDHSGDAINLDDVEQNLKNSGYKVMRQDGESSIYLYAAYENQFASFFQAEDQYTAEQEYYTMIEMWDEIVAEAEENGCYGLTYGMKDNVVYYGTSVAISSALGYYVEPIY